MTSGRRLSTLIALGIGVLALLVVACSSSDPEAPGEKTGTATASATASGGRVSSGGGSGAEMTTEDCEAQFGHPCRRADVDPAALEVQARLASEVAARSLSESREAAFDWVQQQPEVVESHLSGTVMMFRVDGALPTSIITPIAEPPDGLLDDATTAWSTGAPITVDGGPSHHEPILARADQSGAQSYGAGPLRIVGEETDRANPQNRKQALFLEPWGSSEGSLFNAGRVEPRELLGAIPDYADTNSVIQVLDDNADPSWFTRETWRQYDFIYVSSHSGTWEGGAVVESGVREVWDGQQSSYDEICNRLMDPYFGMAGLECGIQQLPDAQFITIDMTQLFFTAQYFDPAGRLDRAIVYIEGCESLKFSALGRTIVADTSAYLGWTDYINLNAARHASGKLLLRLTTHRRNVEAALVTLCEDRSCGGPTFRDTTSNGGDPFLRVLGNSPEVLKLRLYDVAVLRDPKQPTSIGPGLRDGAELRSLGAAGDGAPDQLDIAVELTGVIEQETSSSGEFTNVALQQEGDITDNYFLKVFVNDEEVGSDNLGRALRGEPADRSAVATQIDDETYRYVFTADLPFDVDPEGTDATIKVVVPLLSPDQGESTYEVQVRVLPGEAGATIIVGGVVFEFELTSFFGPLCDLGAGDDSKLVTAGFVDGNLSGTSFSAHLEPGGQDVEGLFSVHGITVSDEETGASWMADDLEFPSLQWLADIPAGGSQIDTITIEGGHAFGTATFIDTNAALQSWRTNGPFPNPVSGSFDIRCGS